jgi:hypothetical protein
MAWAAAALYGGVVHAQRVVREWLSKWLRKAAAFPLLCTSEYRGTGACVNQGTRVGRPWLRVQLISKPCFADTWLILVQAVAVAYWEASNEN